MVRIENLDFGYSPQHKLFCGLNLTLSPGNIYGLLGRNGAGKTSLLKLIAGLRFPGQGTLQVLKFFPQQRHPEFLQDIWFLPEELDTPPISPKQYENRLAPFYPGFDHARFSALLKEFELQPNQNLTSLTYGEKKKFFLAFALSSGARLLLLDEPTNGLDIPSKAQIRRIFASTLTEDKIIVISTHQVRDLENLFDPILILDHGEIIFNQSVQAITEHLAIELQAQAPSDALYSEPAIGGQIVVRPNQNGAETPIDLEVLFNAVISQPDQMRAIFERR